MAELLNLYALAENIFTLTLRLRFYRVIHHLGDYILMTLIWYFQ